MKLLQFLVFQGVWLAAVLGAVRGISWAGPLAVALFVAAHLALLPADERGREARFALSVGLAGLVMDSGLRAAGLLTYPNSAPGLLVPPFIVSLWVAFALLARHALAWLVGRPALAALLGALGGPLSFLAGTRLGAVAPGESPILTWVALAAQYALVTPLLLHWAPVARRAEV